MNEALEYTKLVEKALGGDHDAAGQLEDSDAALEVMCSYVHGLCNENRKLREIIVNLGSENFDPPEGCNPTSFEIGIGVACIRAVNQMKEL